MQGPRPLELDEIDALGAMYGRTIERAPLGIFMPHNPNLFSEGNLENLCVLKDRERVCSHVGLNRFQITSMGCTFSAGCIGGVHTHEDYRKRGLATRILLHVYDRCRLDGVDFLAISGRRGLYSRNHAMQVGTAHRFTLGGEEAVSLADDRLDVRMPDEPPVDELARLQSMEPVRVIRPKQVWEFFALTTSCHFAPSRTFVVCRRDRPVAYLLVRAENRDGTAAVLEFAGDRHDVCGALHGVLQQQEAERVSLQAMGWDSALIWNLQAAGIESRPESTDGTVCVINFAQTLNKLRPRLAERIGLAAAQDLSARSDEDNVTFRLGADELTLPIDSATQLLFGTPPDEDEGDLGASKLAPILREAFPILLPSYGMDYV